MAVKVASAGAASGIGRALEFELSGTLRDPPVTRIKADDDSFCDENRTGKAD
jgi:hypothetical protein